MNKLKPASLPVTMSAKSKLPENSAIVWFRNTDLRLRDNEVLQRAHQSHSHVLHVYVFDNRVFHPATVDYSRTLPKTNWLKTGQFRTKFLLESVTDLRQSLQGIGQDLLVRRGLPEEVIPELAVKYGANHVYCHEAEAPEEEAVQIALQQRLTALQTLGHAKPNAQTKTQTKSQTQKILTGDGQKGSAGVILTALWGGTMYHRDDMPAKLFTAARKFPSTATQFRNIVEHSSHPGIRPPLPPPTLTLDSDPQGYVCSPPPAALQGEDVGCLPTLNELLPEQAQLQQDQQLGNETKISTESVKKGDSPHEGSMFQGGETKGLARLQEYFFDHDCLKDYFDTRNGMLGKDYSSKLSPWLAAGCLSARTIAAEVRRYEQQRVKSKQTYWMLFELTFRDYFRYYTYVYRSRVFHLWGPKGKKTAGQTEKFHASRWEVDLERFDQWRNGQTGNPMIDACMRELLHTGFMSNRGRQLVASFLTRDLKLDWRLGAMHFESLLIDHDVSQNYGNWTYAAGVGSDPREDRYFSIPKQTSQYDPEHAFIKHWCAETRMMSSDEIRRRLKTGLNAPPRPDKNVIVPTSSTSTGTSGQSKKKQKPKTKKKKEYTFT